MPAKKKIAKKTATKKAVKKAAVKKTAKKRTVATKSAAKKVAKKKTVTKKPATKKPVKKTPSKKGAKKKSATKKIAKKKSTTKSRKSTGTTKSQKSSIKSQTRICMTLEEIREVLATRKKEEAAAAKEAAKTKKKKVAPKKAEPIKEEKIENSHHAAASLDDILGLSTPATKSTSVPRKWKKYYNMLCSLRDEVREELSLHSSDTLKKSQKEDGGETVTSSDAGTDTFDRDFALNLLSSEQEALNEIEAAIERVYKGTYGVCEVTNEKISDERLMAVPFTRFSLEGQRQFEMNKHRKVQRSGAFLNDADGEKITFGDDDGDN